MEEKIAAIIEKKRRLMESVVKENDPAFLKAFTREELIQLLSFEGRSEAQPSKLKSSPESCSMAPREVTALDTSLFV